jgi:nucleotide-binding universal stress UspA family protein
VPRQFVVPLDGSELAERAVPVADALAQRVGAGLVLASVASKGVDPHEEYLASVARGVRSPAALEVVNSTDVASSILEVARQAGEATICMTSHGRGRVRWAMVGSVAEAVLAANDEPMFVVGPRCAADWPGSATTLDVCVDASPTSALVIGPACDWASALGLEVAVATVFHPLDVVDEEHPERVLESALELVRAEGLDGSAIVLRGRYVAGALADLADEQPAALLAMMTNARGGFERFVLGSVTMGTVNLAPCPVLVLDRPAAE